MTTRNLARTGAVAVTTTTLPRRKPGRPATPWLRPYVPVPHPQDRRQDRSVPPATIATWCGVSRQTATRWAAAGGITDVPSARLATLLAHGFVIPQHDPQWVQFRFHERWDRKGMESVLVTPGGEALNAQQVWGGMISARHYSDLLRDFRRLRERCLAAEAERDRLRDIVAYT